MHKTDKPESAEERPPLFSPQEIPKEAEPVKFAQSMLVLAILVLVALNFVIEGTYSWIFPASLPLAGYYAFTIHKTGYALGQHEVYHRDRNPIMYKAHLWGAVLFMCAIGLAWIN